MATSGWLECFESSRERKPPVLYHIQLVSCDGSKIRPCEISSYLSGTKRLDQYEIYLARSGINVP